MELKAAAAASLVHIRPFKHNCFASLILLLLSISSLFAAAQGQSQSTSPSTTPTSPPSSSRHTTLHPSTRSPSTIHTPGGSTTSPTASPSPKAPAKNKDGGQDMTTQINFYYVFVGLFVLFLGLCLWLVHVRRRRRNLLLMRHAGQNALARDIDGMPYPNNRRWAAGTGRGDGGMFTMRRDEGLDEQGEAPPPYKPAGPADGRAGQRVQCVDDGYVENGAPVPTGIAIPLQTLSRGDRQTKPPEYYESPTQGADEDRGRSFAGQGSSESNDASEDSLSRQAGGRGGV